MKTIRRNAHRMIDAVKSSVAKVTYYDQQSGGMKDTTIHAAFDDYARFDRAKLYDYGDGKYTIWIHSNLWYHLFTQGALQRIAAEQAERERAHAAAKEAREDARDAYRVERATAERRAQIPADRGVTRAQRIARDAQMTVTRRPAHLRDRRNGLIYVFEGVADSSVWLSDPADATHYAQWVDMNEFRRHFEAICANGNNHMVETCPGCGTEDENGDQVEESAPVTGRLNAQAAVTVTCTRVAIGTQIREACDALGIVAELRHSTKRGGFNYYEVNGNAYNLTDLANLVLEGGFDAAYGAAETRVRWDSPLRVAGAVPERDLGEALEILNDSRGRATRQTFPQWQRARQRILDDLHARALELAPRTKVDFPSGAAEPGPEVTAVECVRTGAVLMRTSAWWTDRETGLQATWYQMNLTDPMSEGFRIHHKES